MASTPLTDPLWAYNVPAWTNQGNTGDIPTPGATGIGATSYLVEPESLSGYISRSMDPAVISGGQGTAATLTNGTLYLTALVVLDPSVTTKAVVNVKTAGSTSTTFLGLYSATGNLVATTASISNIAASTIARNWAASAALGPGVYYGAWLNTAAASGAVPAAVAQTSEQTLLSGTTFPGTSFRFFSTGTSLSGLPASLSTGFTGAGTVAAFTSNWFFGIA